MGADDAELEGQLTDSTSASTSGLPTVEMPDTAESATEDDGAATSLLLRRSGAGADRLAIEARGCDKDTRARSPSPVMEDNFFDWGSLDAALLARSHSGDHSAQASPQAAAAGPAWETAGDVVEEAVEGLVSFATSVADSVAGAVSAVGDAAVSALGQSGGVAGAVLALGEAQHGMKGLDNLTISMPLRPLTMGPSAAAKEEPKSPPFLRGALQTSDEERLPGCVPTVARAAGRAGTPRRRAPSRGAKHAPGEPKVSPPAPPSEGERWRIALLVNGSEGDVRPLLALAKVLAEEMNHKVRILTNTNLVHICLKHGIDAVPVFADSQAVIHRLGGMRGTFMEAVSKPTRAAEKWLKEHEGEYVPPGDALDAFEPHAILAGAQVIKPVLRYEKNRGVPAMPVFLNRPWLEEEFFNVLVTQEPPRPSFYPVSEVVDRKPMPFPQMMRSSAWTLTEEPSLEDLSPGGALCELKDFLDSGAPPVAVGWGSMLALNLPPAEMLELALRALMQAGRRGVVIGGWAELDRMAAVARDGRLPSRFYDGGKLATFAKEKVCFVPWAPHDWLFPRCCCVIHHGGVGTLHAALRACRPSVVTPICADQFVSAEVVMQSHVGVGFSKTLPELKPKDLAHAIDMAVSNPTTIAARTMGRKLLREESESAAKAAGMVDGFMRGKIKLGKSGQWIKRVPAKKAPI